MPDAAALDTFIQNQARALRGKDEAQPSLGSWRQRAAELELSLEKALGPVPQKPVDLEPRIVGVLKREGYRIEKLIFRSRPGVWVTASVYVPEGVKGKVPAVLAVHGHWPMARRDPVVQARCLGLVKLGFVVLAVDAFGAGERHPVVAPSAYHGELLGSTLWPAGHTLLGMQVYDNRRAVDYLLTRPEVDPRKLGITGASGGGNQTMYAGALDERFQAVVPVCSVGNYQAYLKAACCVCEVLPGALTFTEEGDVLGKVAPRALLVISATKDAFQFSVAEAKKSLIRARAIYNLHKVPEKVDHAIFESPHAYNQEMREAMYGWMTRWLKGEGTGKPIPEPKHTIETVEDLACYPGGKRPAEFLFPPAFAAREAKRLLEPFSNPKLDHKEAWEAQAELMRATLRDEVLGGIPKVDPSKAKLSSPETREGVHTVSMTVQPEEGLSLEVTFRVRAGLKGKPGGVLLLHLDGKKAALDHPLAAALVEKGWQVFAPELRGTGEGRPAGERIGGAPDHNTAEHAVWIGRPMLGQWVTDVNALLEKVALLPGLDPRKLAVVGIGQAGLVALCAAGLSTERVSAVAALDAPVSLVTDKAYPAGTRMGLLAPGLFKVGDVPHLASLAAPRKLLLVGGVSAQGKKLDAKELTTAWAHPRKVYGLAKAEGALVIKEQATPAELATALG